MPVKRAFRLLFPLVFLSPLLMAGQLTLDFEGFEDSTPLTTQIVGLTFSNATVLTAGISLNEFEFPPHSGANVVFDDGGPLTIGFAAPISSFSAYFTYTVPLTITALNQVGAQLGSATSLFSNNLALSGEPGSSPNERLSLAFSGGITSLVIAGDQLGGSFVLDDVAYSPVPEPATAGLALLAAFLFLVKSNAICG